MKFVYEYRTKDNVHHDGVICAASREAAFDALRARGIKPGRLAEAPGFFNHLFGKGKRWIAISILAVVCVVLAVCVVRLPAPSGEDVVSPINRRQVYGDPALMEKYALNDYALIFEKPGDRLLAHFAQPAQIDAVIGSIHRDPRRRAAAEADLAALASDLAELRNFPPAPLSGQDSEGRGQIVSEESREASELRRIVFWMRGEFADYLANGNGTPASYLRRLIERQQRERNIFEIAKRELENTTDFAKWERHNAALRACGICTITMPEETRRDVR